MTVGRLLAEADSMELSRWQQFLKADAWVRKNAAESARLERETGV